MSLASSISANRACEYNDLTSSRSRSLRIVLNSFWISFLSPSDLIRLSSLAAFLITLTSVVHEGSATVTPPNDGLVGMLPNHERILPDPTVVVEEKDELLDEDELLEEDDEELLEEDDDEEELLEDEDHEIRGKVCAYGSYVNSPVSFASLELRSSTVLSSISACSFLRRSC